MKNLLERGKAAGILMEAIRFLETCEPMEDEHILDSLKRALREAKEVFTKTTVKYDLLDDEERADSIFTIACIAKELIIEWQRPLN